MSRLVHLLFVTVSLLQDNSRWMMWNLFLAIVPLALSVWLFRGKKTKAKRSIVWVLGCLAFVAFLPNAPYVLTDLIHLVTDIRNDVTSKWLISAVLIPQYLLFMLIGFEAYVISVINTGHYMRQQGWGKYIFWMEIAMHGLNAIGVYLGRFLRLNSWDLLTRPNAVVNGVVDELLSKRPLLVMVAFFLFITVLYWLLKQVTLAIAAYRSTPQHPSTVMEP